MMRIFLTIAAAVSIFSICSSAYAISKSDAEFVEIGDSREAVHNVLGESGRDVSGLKETYEFSEGGAFVAQYDNNTLVRGFLISK